MNQILTKGDILTVYIQETESSEQIRPVKLPVTIVYEDEDLLVINKSAGMPIHPSRNNPDNSLGNALAWYFKEQNKPLFSAVLTGWTVILQDLLLWQNMPYLQQY